MDEDDGIAFLESLARATPGVAPASDSAEGVPAEGPLWRGPEDGPVPVRRVGLAGREVPDLTRIDRERWPEVLMPLSEKDRTEAAIHPLLRDGAALELLDRLPPPASEVAWKAVEASPRIPVPETRVPRAGKQVNVRIPEDDWHALQRAAHILGARPSQLVRMLVLNGVRRVLAEHDAAIAAAMRRATWR